MDDGVVRSSDGNERRAWHRFYDNTLAALRSDATMNGDRGNDFIRSFRAIYARAAELIEETGSESILDAATCFGFLPLYLAHRRGAEGLTFGRITDRIGNGFVVVMAGYTLGAVFTAAVALLLGSGWLLLVAVFFVGFGMSGSSAGIIAIAATVYPVAVRATGVGWAMGIGRVGSIAGPAIALSKWPTMPLLTRGSSMTGTLPTGALPGFSRATARVPARVPMSSTLSRSAR